MKKQNMYKWLALCLALVLIVTSLPLTVVAEITGQIVEFEENDYDTGGNISVAVETETEIGYFEEVGEQETIPFGAVTEIVSLREESVKHFQLPDGTVEATVYSQAVHRKDANGQWQDIDNHLAIQGNSESVFQTADMRTAFSKDKPAWVIDENGYRISMAYESNSQPSLGTTVQSTDRISQMPSAIVHNKSTSSHVAYWNTVEEAQELKSSKSSVLYANIQKNVDIEYVLKGNDIKENIIVNAATGDYTYSFILTLSGLTATLNGDGSVSLQDKKTGEKEYMIPAPYMYDANGEMSYDVRYTLTPLGNDTYTLAVIADPDWMEAEGRAFPVIVDPSVENSPVVRDAYVNSAYPDNNYGDSSELWLSSTRSTYIKTYFPYMPEGSIINSARLNIWYYYHITSGRLTASVYQVLDDWDEHQVTYNTRPQVASELLGLKTLLASSTVTETTPGQEWFYITDLARSWYNGSIPNYGVVIKRESAYNDSDANNSVILKSSETSEGFSPCMVVNYSYYIPDGVYALQNIGNPNRWMDIRQNSVNAGAYVQQYAFGTSPAESFSRSGLFKISRVPNTERYIVRLMLNNSLTLGISGTNVITKEIPVADSEVASSDTFYIISDSMGFVLRPVGQDQVITARDTMASGSAGGTESRLTVVSWDERAAEARWTLEKYTGVHTYGYTLYKPATLYAGETITLSVVVWSTKIDYNTPYIAVSAGYNDYAVGSWNSDTFKGTYSLKTNGDFQITIRIYNGSRQSSNNLYKMLTIELVVDEGVYFIHNKELGVYMQIDNDDAPSYSSGGTIMELWDFDGGDYQKWELIHIGSGYYHISSTKNDLYLAVQSSYLDTGEQSIVQEQLNNESRFQWKITRSSSGAYIIRPKSGIIYDTDWCMCAGSQFMGITDGLNVEQRAYVKNNSYMDEWIICDFDSSVLLAIDDEDGAARHTYFSSTKSNLQTQKNGIVSITSTVRYSSASVDTMISYLKSSDIFIIHTHGDQTGFKISNSGTTYISLTDIEGENLSNLSFALLMTCNTGENYDPTHITNNTPENIIEQMVICGAETVVGFNDTTSVADCNKFGPDITSKLISGGLSVDDAIDSISYTSYIKDMSNIAVVAGNGNNTLR